MKLIGALFDGIETPSFGIPVFEEDRDLFVQIVSPEYKIIDFQKIHRDNLPVSELLDGKNAKSGDTSFFAFRLPNKTILTGSITNMQTILRQRYIELNDFPFIQTEIADFLELGDHEIVNCMSKCYAALAKNDKTIADNWLYFTKIKYFKGRAGLTSNISDYHAKYYAHFLSKIGGAGIDRLGRAIFDACVKVHPHQIEASAFALRSPLSKGVILADEVGLGKTIEAALVLCQYWAEQRRNLLIITPASLRKQWAIELYEKFNLPTVILDAKTYKDALQEGMPNPFKDNKIIICSMHFCANRSEEIQTINWDLVVIDEAHKLRNAYRQSNKIGQRIKAATEGKKKVLLTATPIQNSMVELYGLSSLIDENIFGDLPSFRSQYCNSGGDISSLKDRLASFCRRTLRKQVIEYVPFTERKLITRPFKPTEQEHRLYEAVSTYLQRNDTYALPLGQKHLLVLLVRKVLASSPHALAGTLEMILNRLVKTREKAQENVDHMQQFLTENEINDDLLDELLEDEEDAATVEIAEKEPSNQPVPSFDKARLDKEIIELTEYIRWANSIGIDTKSKKLLSALEIGFNKMDEMGAAHKAVIFTESRRTQAWLKEYLDGNGYHGKVVTFNGTNTDEASDVIYKEWITVNKKNGLSSGSRQIDMRTAIIDRFKTDGNIFIATEAGAEGLNLQFCSTIINYDLPWNPQRIEQRIGRCHRYGQKHDVVVINFLNERNEADRRVLELLEVKFNLFSGVFGASDEVLGAIESGVDFEKRVLEIHQQCRTEKEIKKAFDRLRADLDEQIQNKMEDTRKLLLENFDEDVHQRLKTCSTGTYENLDRIGRLFWTLTKHALADYAVFDDAAYSFSLKEQPVPEIPCGNYQLISKTHENTAGQFLYRISHPLGDFSLNKAKSFACPVAEVTIDITNHPARISLVDRLKGTGGWLSLELLRIDSYDTEEFLLFSAINDNGNNLDQETCEKLFSCGGYAKPIEVPPLAITQRLSADCERHRQAAVAQNLETNNQHFLEARDTLDRWAEDMEMAIQRDLDDVKRQIRDLQRKSRIAPTMQEQHEMQKEIAAFERKKRDLRVNIFKIEDEISAKRDKLVESLEKRMLQKTTTKSLFTIRWKVV
jgi:ERCC4-related helicase